MSLRATNGSEAIQKLMIFLFGLPRQAFISAWLSAINGVPSQPGCLSSLCRQSAPRNDNKKPEIFL